MALRRITQETFDAAVRENIDEFEMDPDEALREAVEQFQSQGIVARVTINVLVCFLVTRIHNLLNHDMLDWVNSACV